MTAPKKPALSGTPPLALTPAELHLVRAYRSMDDRSQAFIDRLLVAQAAQCPRRAAPALTLVVGGAT